MIRPEFMGFEWVFDWNFFRGNDVDRSISTAEKMPELKLCDSENSPLILQLPLRRFGKFWCLT
jgi:hypothetical protein